MSAAARWSVVAGLVVGLVAAPWLLGRWPVPPSRLSAAAVLDRVVASAPVAYSGTVHVDSTLAVPAVRRLAALVGPLAGDQRLRVWYSGPRQWRVDQLTLTGEQDRYADATGTWSWDSAATDAERIDGHPPVRSPRVDDVLPPELARRLAAPASAGGGIRLVREGSQRVAGRAAIGIRIEVSDPGSTIGRVDLWADRGTGLPLRVEVRAKGAVRPVLTTAFTAVSLGRPSRGALTLVPFARAPQFRTDVVATVDEFAITRWPASLGGAAKDPPPAGSPGGVGLYGSGYARFGVVPLTPRSARAALRDLRVAASTGNPTVRQLPGDAAGIGLGPVTAVVVGATGESIASVGYALVGTVPLATLAAAGRQLVAAQLTAGGVR